MYHEIHTPNEIGNEIRLPSTLIARLAVHYPAGIHTVEYDQSCRVNGVQFLTELIKFGWVPGSIIGRTLHLMHPAAPYREA